MTKNVRSGWEDLEILKSEGLISEEEEKAVRAGLREWNYYTPAPFYSSKRAIISLFQDRTLYVQVSEETNSPVCTIPLYVGRNNRGYNTLYSLSKTKRLRLDEVIVIGEYLLDRDLDKLTELARDMLGVDINLTGVNGHSISERVKTLIFAVN